MALKGATFCISGTLSKGRKEVEAEIKKCGGDASSSVTGKVTHLLCAPSEFEGKTAKVSAAQTKGIHIVKEEFLWDAIKARKLPDVGKYLFGDSDSSTAPAADEPKGKRAKPDAGAVPDEPEAKRAKTAATIAVVNPKSGLASNGEVLVHESLVWDVEMVEKDDAKNMDKFYDMQVIRVQSGRGAANYHCFQHWGRTGTAGQQSVHNSEDMEETLTVFKKKFKEKCGYTWGDASYLPAKANKYTVLQRMEVDAVAHKWEYFVEKPVDGKRPGWYPYDDTAVANMERFHSQLKSNPGMGVRYVFSGTWNYEVDFAKMQQMNVDHKDHTIRKIRRVKA